MTSYPRLIGQKVSLYCGGVEHLDAEDRGMADICALLGVSAPTEWPPLHNDASTRQWMRNGILLHPGCEQWWCYYVAAHTPKGEILAGLAGYTGPPGDGEVMIGYSILPEFQRRGLASEAVSLLISAAFARGNVSVVAAETLPDLIASQGVMKKNGMVFVSERQDVDDGTVWRFERRRLD